MKKIVLFIIIITVLFSSFNLITAADEKYIHSFEDVMVSKVRYFDFFYIRDYPEIIPLNCISNCNDPNNDNRKYNTSLSNIYNYSKFMTDYLNVSVKDNYKTITLKNKNQEKLKELFFICWKEYNSDNSDYKYVSDVKARVVIDPNNIPTIEDCNYSRFNKLEGDYYLEGIVFENEFEKINSEIYYDGLALYYTYHAKEIVFSQNLTESIVTLDSGIKYKGIPDVFSDDRDDDKKKNKYNEYYNHSINILQESFKQYIVDNNNSGEVNQENNLREVEFLPKEYKYGNGQLILKIDYKSYTPLTDATYNNDNNLSAFNNYFKNSLLKAYNEGIDNDSIRYQDLNLANAWINIIFSNKNTFIEIEDDIKSPDLFFRSHRTPQYKTTERSGAHILFGFIKNRIDDCKDIIANYDNFNLTDYCTLSINELENKRDELAYISIFLDLSEMEYPDLFEMGLVPFSKNDIDYETHFLEIDIQLLRLYIAKDERLVKNVLESKMRKESTELANTSIDYGKLSKILGIISICIALGLGWLSLKLSRKTDKKISSIYNQISQLTRFVQILGRRKNFRPINKNFSKNWKKRFKP